MQNSLCTLCDRRNITNIEKYLSRTRVSIVKFIVENNVEYSYSTKYSTMNPTIFNNGFFKKSLSFIVRYFVDYFVEYYRPLLKTFSVTNLDTLSRTTTLVNCHRQKVIELLMIVFAQNNSFPKKYLSFLFHLI